MSLFRIWWMRLSLLYLYGWDSLRIWYPSIKEGFAIEKKAKRIFREIFLRSKEKRSFWEIVQCELFDIHTLKDALQLESRSLRSAQHFGSTSSSMSSSSSNLYPLKMYLQGLRSCPFAINGYILGVLVSNSCFIIVWLVCMVYSSRCQMRGLYGTLELGIIEKYE